MSSQLERARGLVEGRNDKRALKALWEVEANARANPEEARGLFESASVIRERSHGRMRADAELLVGYADRYLAQPTVSKIGTLTDCRVVTCEGLNAIPGDVLQLVFTSDGALVQSDGESARELACLKYSEITQMEFEEQPQATSKRRKAGKAALGVTLGVVFGSGDAGWSAAGKLLEPHIVQVTLVTTRGRIVLLRKSPASSADLRNRFASVLTRIDAPSGMGESTPVFEASEPP